MSEPTPYRPRCINLCCKAMLVFGEDFANDPEYQAGMMDFWCTQTSRLQGPDGGDASLEACSNPDRACFQAF